MNKSSIKDMHYAVRRTSTSHALESAQQRNPLSQRAAAGLPKRKRFYTKAFTRKGYTLLLARDVTGHVA